VHFFDTIKLYNIKVSIFQIMEFIMKKQLLWTFILIGLIAMFDTVHPMKPDFDESNNSISALKITDVSQDALQLITQYLTENEFGKWLVTCKSIYKCIFPLDLNGNPSLPHIHNRPIYSIVTPESSVQANNVYCVTWFLNTHSQLANEMLMLLTRHASKNVLRYLLSTIKFIDSDFEKVLFNAIKNGYTTGLQFLLGNNKFMRLITKEVATNVLVVGIECKNKTVLECLLASTKLMKRITAKAASKLLSVAMVKGDIKVLLNSTMFMKRYGKSNADKFLLWSVTKSDIYLVKDLLGSTLFMSLITQHCADEAVEKAKNGVIRESLQSNKRIRELLELDGYCLIQ